MRRSCSKQGREEPLTGGYWRHNAGWWWFKFNSNVIQFDSSFDPTKKDLSALENFEIKYGCEGFEERNSFLHRNFSRFRMDFKWKFRGVSTFRIQ
jgi:hypothetical protein